MEDGEKNIPVIQTKIIRCIEIHFAVKVGAHDFFFQNFQVILCKQTVATRPNTLISLKKIRGTYL